MAALYPILRNSVSSTVQAGSSAIGSATATGVNVATGDGAKFGAVGVDQYIPAVIVDTSTNPETIKEYVYVTAVATDALAVVRQAEDPTTYAASTTTIQAGFTIAAVATASMLRTFGPSLRTGDYYSVVGSNAGGAGSMGLGLLRAAPIYVPKTSTVDRIGLEVTTVGAATCTLRLGIYNDDGTGRPGALLLDAGNTSDVSTLGLKEIVISQVLTSGWYWLAGCPQGTGAGPSLRQVSGNQTFPLGAASVPSANNIGYTYASGPTSGALPDPFPAGAALGNAAPRVVVRGA